MKTVIRKLLVGLAGLVLESLSISKEQLIAQRQQSAALRRVHQAERDFYMASQSSDANAIEQARKQLSAASQSFKELYQTANQLQ